MQDFLASGRVFDLVIAVLAIEGLALVILYRMGKSRLAPRDFGGFILAGLGLAGAARAAASGAGWGHVAAWLCLALAAHVADLLIRASRRPSRT